MKKLFNILRFIIVRILYGTAAATALILVSGVVVYSFEHPWIAVVAVLFGVGWILEACYHSEASDSPWY